MTKYDLHNYKLRFNITHAHNYSGGKRIKMRNWTAFQTKYKGHTIQINPNSILIWSKKRHETEDIDKTSRDIIKSMTETAIDFCKKNNIKIYQIPIPIGKEIKILNYRVDGNFITPSIKAVYPKPSPVETMGKNAENLAKDYVMNAKQIAEAMTSWSKKMDFYANNYEAHVDAINNLNQAVNELRRNLNKPTLVERIKRWFK